MGEANFALRWLDFLGNKIYNNGQQIFIYDKSDYEFFPPDNLNKLDTKIKYGEDIGDGSDYDYSWMPYPEFQRLNFVVLKGTDFLWKPRQRCYFKLNKKSRNVIGLSDSAFSRADLKLQHDPARKRIRLFGENVLADDKLKTDSGIGPWINYEAHKPSPRGRKKKHKPLSKEDYRAQVQTWMYGKRQAQPTYIPIKELPILISEENYIVCMKKQTTCQRIIVLGESGQGKSVFTNGLDDGIFYGWQDRVAWLIDPLNQFEDLSLPQNYSVFNKINETINHPPRPFPAVQLYLACKNKLRIKHEDISLIVTQDFLEFLNKYKFYTYGIKDYDVGDTIRYLQDFLTDIKDVETGEDIKNIMFEKIPNAHKDKGMQAMIYKWGNTFDTILKEKFTSNLYKGRFNTSSELEVEMRDGRKMKGHPFIMCYEAGIVPVFNISAARRQRWVRNYLADLMQKIVRHQSEMPDEHKKRVWIIADELNEIYEVGKKKDNAFSAFEELFRQGRFNNIGFIGNTQSLDKLNPEMYKNATHICCTYIKEPKERRRVGDTYNLPKETYQQIGELKPQEMMVFSKEPFVIYDKFGRRRVVDDRKWFKGKIIPPMNYHKIPT